MAVLQPPVYLSFSFFPIFDDSERLIKMVKHSKKQQAEPDGIAVDVGSNAAFVTTVCIGQLRAAVTKLLPAACATSSFNFLLTSSYFLIKR